MCTPMWPSPQSGYKILSAPTEDSLVTFSTAWHPPHPHHNSAFCHHKRWFSTGGDYAPPFGNLAMSGDSFGCNNWGQMFQVPP